MHIWQISENDEQGDGFNGRRFDNRIVGYCPLLAARFCLLNYMVQDLTAVRSDREGTCELRPGTLGLFMNSPSGQSLHGNVAYV